MNPWFTVLTVITLNVNGLGDKDKWTQLWGTLPRSDILCFQEIHLCTLLEFAFKLNAQGYDFYYSHGTSASAGVCTAIRHALDVKVVKFANMPGRLLALDLTKEGHTVRVIIVYAPNNSHDRAQFFSEMEGFLSGNLMVLSDFNSVTSSLDHFSHKLDSTSSQLLNIF